MNKNNELPIGYVEGESTRNNISEFLREHALNNPERILLYWERGPLHEKGSIKAAALWDLVCRTASGFSLSGINPGDRVIVFLPMSLQMYTAMFALQHMGAVAVFLDSWARRNELGISASIANPQGFISTPQAFELLKENPAFQAIPFPICFGGEVIDSLGNPLPRLEDLMECTTYHPTQAVEPQQTALITFTTGSSGRPKGANRTHRFLAAQHYALRRHLPYTEGDVDLPVFPIFSLNNIASGISTVLPAIDLSKASPEDANTLIRQFEEMNVRTATLSPWLFRTVADACLKQDRTLSLRRIVTGGAPIGRDDVSRMMQAAPQATILILYGSTEVEPIARINAADWLSQKSQSDEDSRWVDRGVNVGTIDEGLKIRFAQITELPYHMKSNTQFDSFCVKERSVGELLVAGEHVCQAYFNDENATMRAKIVDAQGCIWHRTGDLGYLDADRQLWLVGRVHNVIRHKLGPLFPVRAEMVLRKLPFAQRAAYLGVPCKNDPEHHQNAWAIIQVADDQDKELCKDYEAEVAEILQYNGIHYDRILFVKEIPMDARHHSKVEYDVLRQQLTTEDSQC